MINKNAYEKRKTEAESTDTRRVNELIDAAEVADTPFTVDAPLPSKQPKQVSRKQQREQEAEAWLAQHSTQLDDDIDAQLGLTVVNAREIAKAASEDLPM